MNEIELKIFLVLGCPKRNTARQREDASEEANPELTKEARAQFYTHTNADFKRFDPSDLPPIEVYGATAVCDGHPLEGLGHPREFIRTDYAYPVR